MWPPTGLIPWFSKTKGNTYTTLLHHPFLFMGKPTQCSRGSKKDFWRRFRGVYAQVNIPSTHHKLLSLASHYLPFASPFPLPHFTLAVLFALFFRLPLLRLPLACLCVGLFVTMAQDNTKLCDFFNTNNNDFLSTPIVGEVSLGPLGNAHHYKPCKQCN